MPYLVTFDQNGSMTSISWELLGGNIPQGTTASGNTFALSPGDAPTTITARLNAGARVEMLTVTAPVESADGTIDQLPTTDGPVAAMNTREIPDLRGVSA